MKYCIDLDYEDLCRLLQEYNSYIMKFDYTNSGIPVCVAEFYENEYQEIINYGD